MKRFLQLFFTIGVLLVCVHVRGQDTSKPSIKFFLGDKELESKAGVSVTELSKVSFRLVPAASDASDVTYAMHWKMYLRRGTGLGAPVTGTTTSSIPGAFMGTARAGDIFSLEVETLRRTDAAGKTTDVKLSSDRKYLSLLVTK